MSQEVSEGVWVSTYAGRARTEAGPFHAFDLWGEKVEAELWHRPLHEATDEIYALTHAPDQFDGQVMRSMRQYIKGLNLVEVENSGGQRPVEAFRPSSLSVHGLVSGRHADSSAEPLVFLGNPMPQDSFVDLVDYVMTNTGLWPEDLKGQVQDPRVGMVERFRSEA